MKSEIKVNSAVRYATSRYKIDGIVIELSDTEIRVAWEDGHVTWEREEKLKPIAGKKLLSKLQKAGIV